MSPALLMAQVPLPVPRTATEAKGFIPEPDPILRVTLFADRQLGKGDLNNGLYVDYSSMIPGSGAIAGGPGYRHWYAKDQLFIDGAASISVRGYRQARGRIELPSLAKSRLVLGTETRWLDFDEVQYYGNGPLSSLADRSIYRINAAALAGYATIQPTRWLGIGTKFGWMNPTVEQKSGSLPLQRSPEKRTFVPAEAGLTIDTRDFPGHPTRGGVLHAVAARYFDHGAGSVSKFNRYDGEVAGFLPLFGSHIVLALHGWGVSTRTEAGRSVPFYLQPSLGGANTLRSYADYRFHGDNMLLATAELRLAMMTHVDLAFFADGGNVANRWEDLNLDRQSFGGGVRFHTRRFTFATVDAARGGEGWRVLFRLIDPLQLQRITKTSLPIPFVP